MSYLQTGDVFSPIPTNASVINNLSPGLYRYVIAGDPSSKKTARPEDDVDQGTITFSKVYFEKVGNGLNVPSEIYGNTPDLAARVIATYFHRADQGENTGCLSYGPRGSGKTILMNVIANQMIQEHNAIALTVPGAFSIEKFVSIVSKFTVPIVILFDEFDKTHKSLDEQNTLLTLTSGSNLRKAMFLFTVNDYDKIGENFKERPSRVFYTFQYSSLDESFVKAYCSKHLKNKKYLDDLLYYASISDYISADILGSIIQECNRSDDHPFAVAVHMGIISKEMMYRVKVYYTGVDITGKIEYYGIELNTREILLNPDRASVVMAWVPSRRAVFTPPVPAPTVDDKGNPLPPPEPDVLLDIAGQSLSIDIANHTLLRIDENNVRYYQSSKHPMLTYTAFPSKDTELARLIKYLKEQGRNPDVIIPK